MKNIKLMLDKEVNKRNSTQEVSEDKPDPILIAKQYNNETISLICAMFAYGNAKLIVKFLKTLDFDLLTKSDEVIAGKLKNHYYRFQSSNDIINFFITLKRVRNIDSLNNIFLNGYIRNYDVLDGIKSLLEIFNKVNNYTSRGYGFLIGKIPTPKIKSSYKRWNMYLRWMVRSDNIDMGLWKGVNTEDLLIPLDTHTFNVSHKLGLLKRKTYDLKAVKELSLKLKEFDSKDPIKYDFALYRIGQEKIW